MRGLPYSREWEMAVSCVENMKRCEMPNKKKIRSTVKWYQLVPGIILIITLSCTSMIEPEEFVPPTVADDNNLPSISIQVAGHTRKVHYKTFGDPSNKAILVVHGSLSDMHPYMALSALSDSFYVVFWDMRGNGLSERVTDEELSFDAMVEEYHVIKEHFSPDEKAVIVGASWSAVFSALYIQEYPNDCDKAILMEPIGLKDEYMDDVGQALDLFQSGYMDMNWASDIITTGSHELLDYRMHMMLSSGVRDYFCNKDSLPDWPVWRVGGLALIVWENAVLEGPTYSYDFTTHADAFNGDVLFVGTSCSPIGYAFQEEYNLPVFQHASSLRIENSGHRIVTEQPETLLNGIRTFLNEE